MIYYSVKVIKYIYISTLNIKKEKNSLEVQNDTN